MDKEPANEILTLFNHGQPIPGKACIVPDHRKCDFCRATAMVDGKTKQGIWANMCLAHFLKQGMGLGPGKGQVIIWKPDVQHRPISP